MKINYATTKFARSLDATEDLSHHTVRAYESDLRAFERFVGCSFDTADLTLNHLVQFIAEMNRQGLNRSSVRRRVAGIRKFCRWLVENGIIEKNPADGLTVRLSQTKTLPRALSCHDLEILMLSLRDAATSGRGSNRSEPFPPRSDTTILLAVSLMISTGIRVGELVALRIADLDLSNRSIRVLGKGRRERMVYLTNDWICAAVTDYLDRSERTHVDSPLLLNRDGSQLTTAAVRGLLARAAERAGLTKRVTPHMLRHTAATQLIEAGVDIRFVQRLLGHASIVTTEIYTHVADTALRHQLVQADILGTTLTTR